MNTLFAYRKSGNCMKPWLAMGHLDQPIDVTLIDALKCEQEEPANLMRNPSRDVPFLDAEKGVGLGEDNAMPWFLTQNTHLMLDTRNSTTDIAVFCNVPVMDEAGFGRSQDPMGQRWIEGAKQTDGVQPPQNLEEDDAWAA